MQLDGKWDSGTTWPPFKIVCRIFLSHLPFEDSMAAGIAARALQGVLRRPRGGWASKQWLHLRHCHDETRR